MESKNPRRSAHQHRKLKPWKQILRSYIPLAAIIVVVVLFGFSALGSINRANEHLEQDRLESIALEASMVQQQAEWEQEALQLVAESEKYAANCQWDKAIAVLDQFSGNLSDFDVLTSARQTYEDGDSKLIPWKDPTAIPFLSFSKLIADPSTDFSGSDGDNNRYLYISCSEFTAILQQLYDNDYMLVSMSDIFTTTWNIDGSTQIIKDDLRLPAGKKPIVLVYAPADGYDDRLVLDENGNVLSFVIPEEGEPYTTAYDFISLLDDFIDSHPGFSYKGSRAILALTAHDGLFGYPLEATANILHLVKNLKEKGYTLACSSYSNISYGKASLSDMQYDIGIWKTYIDPMLGNTDTIVFDKNGDIDDGKDSYSNYNKKYQKLYVSGFRYYLGTSYSSSSWMSITDKSIRVGRIMVTGGNLKDNPSIYANLFDATQVYGAQ